MKFKNFYYYIIFLYLLSFGTSYSIEQPDIKNLIIHKEKKIHRDGSISFYVKDPDGNILQILWHPTLSNET